ncbi:MAG: LicD family protein [Epsilonproteobacteria bacterium]|nr:LicD family protein [Campylobacterota bacterium]
MVEPKILREAQLIMLDILVEFDKICRKHNLKYWLDSGTLLGAVRHGGFIPWDDDIDISMPLEDYKKFEKIALNELSDTIFFQTNTTDPKFPFDYIKLRSNRAKIVEFHEKGKEIKYHQGVFVDIFPMLNIPNSEFHYKFYSDIFALIRRVSAKSLHTPDGKDMPKIRHQLQNSLLLMHQKGESKVIYGGEMPDVSAWFDYDKIFPLQEMRFEGINFYVPNDPHHYLENIYSFNYMELPPPEGRVTHAHSMEVVE